MTKVDPKTGFIAMKKGEAWINFVTRLTTFIFGCNTDTTCLMSGTAVKAVIIYVTDYITKPGLKTHVMFDAIQSIIGKSAELISGDIKAKEKARQLLTKIVNLVSARMELGAPMICLYLLGNPDHYTSHIFKDLYWRQYVAEARRAFPDDVPEEDRERVMMIRKDNGEYIQLSYVFDYTYRPIQAESLTVFEFMQRCTKILRNKKKPDKLPKNAFTFLPDHPLAETHLLKINVGAIDNIVPSFTGGVLPRPDVGDPDNFSAAMLTLFKPWRTGRDLRYQDQTWSQAYQAYEFPSRYKSIIQNINLRYECLDARDDYRAQMKNGVHPEMGFAGGFDHDPQEDVDIAPEWTWMQETPAVYLDAGDEVASKLSKNEQRKLDSMKEIAALLQDIGWDKPPAESTSLDKGKDYRWGSLDAIGKWNY